MNSSVLQYSLESLTRQTSYTVQVMASTRAGGANGTRINFKTLSISEYSFQASIPGCVSLPFPLDQSDILFAEGRGKPNGRADLNEKSHLLSGALTFLKGMWVRRE